MTAAQVVFCFVVIGALMLGCARLVTTSWMDALIGLVYLLGGAGLTALGIWLLAAVYYALG